MGERGRTTDLFQILIHDHLEILEKFEEMDLLRTRASMGEEKRELLREIAQLLQDHFHLEEDHIYPQLQVIPQVKEAVHEALAEHQELLGHLEKLQNLDPESEQWEDLFDRIEAARDDHFAVEETEIFAEAREYLMGDELSQLGERVAAERDELMKRTPHLPEQGTR